MKSLGSILLIVGAIVAFVALLQTAQTKVGSIAFGCLLVGWFLTTVENDNKKDN